MFYGSNNDEQEYFRCEDCHQLFSDMYQAYSGKCFSCDTLYKIQEKSELARDLKERIELIRKDLLENFPYYNSKDVSSDHRHLKSLKLELEEVQKELLDLHREKLTGEKPLPVDEEPYID